MRRILFSAFGYNVISAPIFAGLAGLAAFLFLKRFRDYMRLGEEDFWNLILGLVISVPSGAVLFYSLLYGQGPAHNFSVLLSGHLPGGSFWGSLLTAFTFTYLYCRFRGLEFRPVGDGLGLSALLALSIMRIGCILHGCCYGAPTTLPWGVRYYDPGCIPGRYWPGVPLHPSQLYESAGSLLIFLVLHRMVVRMKPKPGTALAFSIVSYSVLRFLADFTRGGDRGLLTAGPFTTSQLIALAGAAAGIAWYKKYA